MTNYKSDLTEILTDIEQLAEDMDNGQIEVNEAIDTLNSIYDKINSTRWQIEEHIATLLQDIECMCQTKLAMED